MGPNFRPYLSKVNDQMASIMVDLGLRAEAPVEGRPWLLWVWVHMRSPRPDGLSSSAEAPKLYEVEDALDLRLSRDLRAVLAGRVTTERRREFYFYSGTKDGFDDAVRQAMAGFREYSFDVGFKEDPLWTQYLTVLHPSAEDLERIKNGDVLDSMSREGDRHAVPRAVMHWACFGTLESRSMFMTAAADAGFTFDSEYEVEGDRSFWISIQRTQAIEPQEIDKTTIQLLRLAERFDGDYDGWEAQVTTQ